MGREMKALAITTIMMSLCYAPAWGLSMPVSPEGPTGQACPTFSWSAAYDAAAYRLEVYEQLTGQPVPQEQMAGMAAPVLAREIPAPALSWTPSSGECLSAGIPYVWYIRGIGSEGEGQWSGGRLFQVEAPALSVEQRDVVREALKSYLSADSTVRTATAITPMASEGPDNTTYGTGAGTTGTGNVFFGVNAGTSNTTGSYNSYIGKASGYANTTGNNNTAVGFGAGRSGGGNNSSVGFQAGFYNTGTGNVFLGYQAGHWELGSGKLYVANSSTAYPLIYGDFSTAALKVYGSLTVDAVAGPSDERYKKDIQPLESSLVKVLNLQGVSYSWKTEENPGRGFREGRQIGLIAQEVEKILPELVQTDEKGYKALSYDKLVPVLIEAMKEQQKEIKEKDARIGRLEKALEMFERRLASLEGPAKTVALK